MLEGVPIPIAGGNVQKSPSSKATATLTRGAYSECVSTAKWRERRWRLFSTFPQSKQGIDNISLGHLQGLSQLSDKNDIGKVKNNPTPPIQNFETPVIQQRMASS